MTKRQKNRQHNDQKTEEQTTQWPKEEEQTTQWPKEEGQSINNDLKTYTENQRSSNTNPT